MGLAWAWILQGSCEQDGETENGPKVGLDTGRRLWLVSTWLHPHPYLFPLFLIMSSALTLHVSSNCMVRSTASPHLCSTTLIQSPPSSSCHANPWQALKGTDPSTLMRMSPNEDIYKYGHIRAHHLAVPLGWLRSPQISGHGDCCGQPIIPPSPAPALTGTDALSNTASGWRPRPRAKQRAIQSEAVSWARITLPLHTLFPGLPAPACSPASFPLKVQISFMHPQQHCKGDEPLTLPLLSFLACVSPASAFLSISTTFFSFLVCLWHTFSSAPGTIFLSTGQNDKLKIFISRKTQDLSFNFCLFGWVFLEKQSFQIGWKILFDLYEKKCLFFPKFFFFLKEVFQNKTVNAKWETKIVHFLQIISPFSPPQKQACCTKSINPPQTVCLGRRNSTSAEILLPSYFFPPYFSLWSSAHSQMPPQSTGQALWEVPARGKVHWTAVAHFAPQRVCSHRTPKKIVFSLKYMNIWYPPSLPPCLNYSLILKHQLACSI